MFLMNNPIYSYAGQFVMAGFLDLRVKKWIRVLVTRLVAIVPTVAVALLFDSSENELDQLSEWLNVLQSIQLPFALIPLLCLVSNVRVMGDFVIGTVTKVKNFPLEVCRTFKCSLCIDDLLQVQNLHPFGQCFTQH